ncbi:hypothetical protein EST38_g4611 [Candolleomyces aberdarensis]|uniref:MYND-type domain-containing protein n=1 Tax=Candolleomyces aberdarensis TaxID=2316362 RepID=A0A4Q2DQV4_9AGAR|nr:hypothetical protein EST38_g4611 [Candolleomyces aberdarensis]
MPLPAPGTPRYIRNQLVRRIQSSKGEKERLRAQIALAEYLAKEDDLGLMVDILEPFGELVPKGCIDTESLDYASLSAGADALAAWSSIVWQIDVMTVAHPSFPVQLEAYKSALFPRILDRWEDITKWIRYLVYYNPRREPYIFSFCCDFIRTTHLEKNCGNYVRSLYGMWLRADTTIQAFSSRLRSLDKSTRHHVASALVSRAKAIVQNPREKDWCHAIHELHFLSTGIAFTIQISPTLHSLFKQYRFLYEYSNALSTLVRRATSCDDTTQEFWTLVAKYVWQLYSVIALAIAPDQNSAIADLAEGGLLLCAYCAIVHHGSNTLASGPPPGELRRLYLFVEKLTMHLFYVRSIFRAVSSGSPVAEVSRILEASTVQPLPVPLWEPFFTAYDLSRKAFKDEQAMKYLCLCHNINRSPHANGCHSAFYCSNRCQEEDWVRFHKSECSALRRIYLEQKLRRCWTLAPSRFDQVVYLNFVLNNILDPMGALILWGQDTVFTVDVANVPGLALAPLPLEQCRTTLWPTLDYGWSSRLEAFLDDLEKDESLRLAQGIFTHPVSGREFVVLAKIKCDFSAGHEKGATSRLSTILSTVSRTCIHKESNEATIFVNVISISKLHILLLTDVVEIGPSDSDDKEWSTSLELLELVTEGQDRNPQLEMRRVGRLGFIHAEDDWSAIYSFANCQGKLAFYSVGGATVVWDPIPGRGAGWRLDGVVDVMEIFCNDDFVMYLNPEGIHAIKIPDLQPLENGQITFSFFEATRLAPTFSLPYSHSHSFTTGFHSGNIVFPAICQPDRPLVFVVKETLSEAMIHGYWYQFDFNQTCPRESTFKMVGSFRLPTPHINALHLMSYPYHLCGDMAAIIVAHKV